MIKYIYIIFFIIFMGCNQLIEKTSPLDGVYYINDGWAKFELEEYDRAHELFSTVLLNNTTQYFPEAYVGLAWNSIYKANTIQGSLNWFQRDSLRNISNQYFIFATAYDDICFECGEDNPVLCENLLTGRTYNSSYQALESSRKFYDEGLDSANWENMVYYSNETINISDTLFQCNENYIFNHDEYIDFNRILILRAQTFVRLGDFESAESELEEIQNLECDLNVQTVVECLNSLD